MPNDSFINFAMLQTSVMQPELAAVTLCCSEPPKGFPKWSLRILADKMVEINYVDSISRVTVRNV